MCAKRIGILGGMGPQATADLFLKVIKATPAGCDQEHLRIVIDNYPQIPDRTKAILEGGEDPLPYLVDAAENLVRAGAELIIMPCNTAHYFHGPLQEKVPVPILHMIRLTAQAVRAKLPNLSRVGLLATSGTVKSQLYHQAFAAQGIETLVPEATEQENLVMEAIYGREGIKAGFTTGDPRERMIEAARRLIARGAEAIVAGCTEIPLVLTQEDLAVPLLDPTTILAEAAVKAALASEEGA